LRGKEGDKIWAQILNLLYKYQVPLIAHNLTFDLAWMLRDLNLRDDGSLPSWFSEFKKLKLHACTLGLLRQLASEGFPGQEYNLGFAQKHLLGWDEVNKVERNKRLCEAGILKKRIPKYLLMKLTGGESGEYNNDNEGANPNLHTSAPNEDDFTKAKSG